MNLSKHELFDTINAMVGGIRAKDVEYVNWLCEMISCSPEDYICHVLKGSNRCSTRILGNISIPNAVHDHLLTITTVTVTSDYLSCYNAQDGDISTAFHLDFTLARNQNQLLTTTVNRKFEQ